MVAEQEIVMEAERNQKIEIEKLEESRNLAQKEMEKLQISLKDSNEELGQAKMRMDSAIAEKEAALNQIDSMKEHFEVRWQRCFRIFRPFTFRQRDRLVLVK